MNLSINLVTTILIVDDSESDRVTYHRFLQMDGDANYQILEASSLEEGLALWRSQQPNLALIDINLPDGSGLEFLAAIQGNDPNLKLPIIAITGQSDERIAVQAMKLGASDYLIKEDITASFLRRCVTNVLNQITLAQKLARSQQKESLLARIALNTRKFLNQEEIYQAIVTEVREFLAADRVIIYQFNPDMSGLIVAESVIPPWSSCLHTQIIDTCFQENLGGEYCRGRIFIADDIYTANLTDCHLQLLEQFQIRANLVVPILLPTEQEQDFLWGLLAFHQCSGPRHWDETDLCLINRLSLQLEIAIQQADLYWELKAVNQSLEQKVEERTTELQRLLTQHQQIELELAQQTTLLRETQEFARLGSWYLDAQTETVHFSPEVLKIFGLDVSQTIQPYEAMTDFVAPCDRDRRNQIVRHSLTTGEPYEADFQIIRADGSSGYVFSKGKAVRNEDGQITGLTGILMDISDRKQAELSLKESEERFRQLAENINQVFYLIDVETSEILYISPNYEKLWGRSRQSLYERPLSYLEAVHPEEQYIALNAHQQKRQLRTMTSEYRIIQPNGSIRWIYDSYFPICNDLGEVYRICGIADDISERKAQEEALRISEARFQKIAATLPGILYTSIQSPDGSVQFTYVNAIASEILELDIAAILNNSQVVFDLFHPDDWASYTAAVEKSVATMQPLCYEWRLITPSGKLKWMRVNSRPEALENGEIAWYGIALEITEQKQAEAKIKALQEQLSRVLRGSNDGWWDWDIVTNELYLSPSWWRMIGYEDGELESTFEVWQSLIHPDDCDHVKKCLDRALSNPNIELDEFELRMRHKQGHYVPILSRGIIERDASGRPVQSSGTNIDLTLLKQKERELQTAVDSLYLLNNQLEERVRQRTEELERSQHLIERILNTSPNLIYLEDVQLGRLIFVNQMVSTLLGYSPNDLLTMGTSFLERLIHPDDLNRIVELGQRERNGEIGEDEIVNIEYRIRDREGNWRWFLSYETIFSRDEQGKVKEIIGNAQDISIAKQREAERKKTEEALRLSEQRFRNAFDNTAVGMCLVSTEGKFLKVNTAICQFLGYEESELLKLTFQKVTYPDDLDRDTTLFQQMLIGDRQNYTIEKRYVNKQGDLVWGLLSVSLVRNSQNQPVYCVSQVQNITNRKLAELKAQRSEQRFNTLFESSVVGMILCNFQGSILDANNYFLETFGYSREELEQGLMHWGDMTPPEHTAKDLEVLKQLTEQGFMAPWEKEYYHKNGQRIPILVGAVMLPDTTDQVIAVVVDISDRKRAEIALQESEAKFRVLTENIPGVIYRYVLHPDGTDQFIYVNPYIQTIYGVTVEATLDDPMVLFSKVHADDIQLLRNEVVSSAQTLTAFYSEHRITATDGTLKWVQVTAIPEQLTNGDILWQGIILDISDRKQAEKALRESQQFIQTIINTVPLPLFWKNRESVFLGCNQQLGSILGFQSSDEIIGKTDFDLSPTVEQARLYRAGDQRVMNSGIAEHGVEETQTLENGDVIWIETHKAPLRDADNNVIGVVGLFQDITDRKHYELQLQQKNQELQALLQLREEALTLREDMSNMIVHDLRNPLATIILAASIIRKYYHRIDQQALLLKKADQILESSKQLQTMVDSLLFMAKLESGTLLFNPTETDLHFLGTAVMADFDLIATSSQIDFVSELPPSGNRVLVDATILRRIIDNLLSNAFKFSPIGGTVSFSLEYLPNNRVKVKVTDTGVGISEEEKQKIFNKFEIGSLKQGVHQTGLGLAFCKMVVEAQQGTLAIERNDPQGSIFIVEI